MRIPKGTLKCESLFNPQVLMETGNSMGTKRGISESKASIAKPKSIPTIFQIFEVLSDPLMAKMLKIAYSGVKGDFSNVVGNLTKRQYGTRIKRLRELGLVERQDDSMYRTTSLGALVYNSNFRTLEKILDGFWHLHAIDVLKGRSDLPGTEKDIMIKQLLEVTELNQV